jgi:apolipoprotein N-acyltransferase
LAVLLLFLAAGLVALGQLAHPAFGIGAAVVAGLGLVAFLAERAQRSTAERRPPSLARLGTAGLWWIMLCLGLFGTTVGLISGQSLLVVSGVSVLLAAGAAWALVRRRGNQ